MKPAKENAVSPVVGVMLMLVITLIIAALVSAFAGGLIPTDTQVPKTTFSVTSEIIGSDTSKNFNGVIIRNTGGDIIELADTSVSLSSRGQTITLSYLTNATFSLENPVRAEQLREHTSYYAMVGGVQKSGSSEITTLKPADSFMVIADGYVAAGEELEVPTTSASGGPTKNITGPCLYWRPELAKTGNGDAAVTSYGLFTATINEPMTYGIIDKNSGKTIQTGSITLR